MSRKNIIGRSVLVGLSVVLTLMFYGGAIALYGKTVVSLWIPVVGAAAVAAASGTVLWRLWTGVTGSGKFVWNFLCQTVFATGLLWLLFLLGNHSLPSRSALHDEKAVAAKVYAKTHYRSKRVSRNRYTRGEPYKVYYMEAELSGGKRKELSLNAEKFRRIHKGDLVTLSVRRGYFGFTVIEEVKVSPAKRRSDRFSPPSRQPWR